MTKTGNPVSAEIVLEGGAGGKHQAAGWAREGRWLRQGHRDPIWPFCSLDFVTVRVLPNKGKSGGTASPGDIPAGTFLPGHPRTNIMILDAEGVRGARPAQSKTAGCSVLTRKTFPAEPLRISHICSGAPSPRPPLLLTCPLQQVCCRCGCTPSSVSRYL